MDLWTIDKWKTVYSKEEYKPRGGLRLRFDNGVNGIVKESCKEFCKWLRSKYCFPVRVPIYVARHIGLRCRDGDIAMGTILLPYSRREEPYIRIASGRFNEGYDWDKQLFQIFFYMAHELTHYFQWINDMQYTDKGTEWQASIYANRVIDHYKAYYNLNKAHDKTFCDDHGF